jgi:trigger factor
MSTEDTANVDVDAQVALAEGEAPFKMNLSVEITAAGPCRKHVKVHVPRADIDHFYNDAVKELVSTAAVPGFRTGHVPRTLIEKRFRKDVVEHVRQKVLMQSLQQIGEEQKLDAINEPDLDVESIQIPDEGDFTYEFDVEVRPEFDVPNYGGLKIKRPVRTVSDDDVQKYLERYLTQFGQLAPLDAPAEAGDYIVATVSFESGGQALARAEDKQIRIRPTLRFRDAEVAGFDKLMAGATPDTTRETEATISVEAPKTELRGEKVNIRFEISDVKRLKLPAMDKELFDQLGVESEEELRNEIRSMLERQTKYDQREAVRRQVIEQITASATWDLPESLVKRQVENAMYRVVLEMAQAGFTEEQIRARQNEMLQNQITETRQALKEHFLLDKIATQEKLQVTAADKDLEISFMAMQRGESPRKVRARLEKQGLMENLEAQILERKAVDFILEKAEFEDVPAPAPVSDTIEAVDISVCGIEEKLAPTLSETAAAAAEPAPQPGVRSPRP